MRLLILCLSLASLQATDFISSVTTGTLRNNSGLQVGLRFTVKSNPLTLTRLGRWCVAGNTGTHLVSVMTNPETTVASASIAMTGCAGGTFQYAAAPGATLAAGTVYYLVSQEMSGGDSWYDANTSFTTTSDAATNSAVYLAGTFTDANGTPGTSYVPVSFSYTTGTPPPPPPPPPQVPTLTSLVPTAGASGANLNVTLTGTNFVAGTTASSSNPGVSISSVNVVSETQITATLAFTANAAGSTSVTVTTPGGTSGPVSFSINPATTPPTGLPAGMTFDGATFSAGDEHRFPSTIPGRGPQSLNRGVSTFLNTGDPVISLGYNEAFTGVVILSGEPGLSWNIEGNFNDGSGHNKMEAYLQYVAEDGSAVIRPFMFQIDRTTKKLVGSLLQGDPVNLNSAATGEPLAQFWRGGIIMFQPLTVPTLKITNLPTSCAAQPTGTIWNSAGMLGICP